VTKFFCVITNRDKLRIDKGQRNEHEEPIWKFLDPKIDHFLVSLVYIVDRPNLPDGVGPHFFDCGAWSYKKEDNPRWGPEDCITQYARFAGKGDLCAAPDHMVLSDHDRAEALRRQRLSLRHAERFLELSESYDFTPIAVVHGKRIRDRISMLQELVHAGYSHVALGGLAMRAQDRRYILRLLTGLPERNQRVLQRPEKDDTVLGIKEEHALYLHILGISALSWYDEFRVMDIDSYDGSTMFLQAFRGAQYYWYSEEAPYYLEKITLKGRRKESVPQCSCLVCSTLKKQGIDTREMGSNENNLGRAVHNINMYLKAKARLDVS
jgi:hypothetical protein